MITRRKFLTITSGGLIVVNNTLFEQSLNTLFEQSLNTLFEQSLRVQILQCDIPNKNKCIYPRHVVESAIKDYKSGEMLGMLGLVLGVPPLKPPYLKFADVSHQMYDLEIESVGGIQTLFGKVRLLDTPCGKVAKNMIDEGVEVAFRTLGLGNAKANEEGNLVISDYEIISINMVLAENAA